MGRIRQGLAPMLLAPHGYDGLALAGRPAVAVALQNFGPDSFLNLLDGLSSDVFLGLVIVAQQRIDDSGFRPLVELLHE